MKIAITSQEKDLNAEVDSRFGRCQYFIIYDVDKGDFESLENPNVSAGGGAGIQAAKTISEKGAEAVLTGNVGPNAFDTLSAAGIAVYTGISGKVIDAVGQFKEGNLEPHSAPSVKEHYGLNANMEKTSTISEKKYIAIAAEDDAGLDAIVSAHFGRCPYYTIVEIEGDKITSSRNVGNPFYGAHGQPGQVPAFIRDQGAKVIIAGGMGQRAVGFFNDFGIEVVTGCQGEVRAVVDAYLKGLIAGASPCEHEPCH